MIFAVLPVLPLQNHQCSMLFTTTATSTVVNIDITNLQIHHVPNKDPFMQLLILVSIMNNNENNSNHLFIKKVQIKISVGLSVFSFLLLP